MKITELSIVILYIVGCIGIGFWGRSKIKEQSSEYWVSGRNINTFINSWAVLATLTSGGSILAAPGTAFKLGLPYGSSLVAGAIVGFSLASILVAKYLYNAKVFTVPEFLQKRYDNNPVIGVLAPIVILICNGIYMVSQLKATGLVVSYIIGIPYLPSLVIGTLVFIFYVSIGGMWAITYTDILQGMLKTFIVMAMAVIILSAVGLGDLLNSATKAFPSIGTAQAALPYSSYIGGFLTWALAVPVLPHLMMRVFTAKDQRSARLSLNWGMLIYAFVMTAGALVLTPAISLLPPNVIKKGVSDQFMLNLGDKFFGPVLQGLLVAAVMAAVMSAASGLLLACTSSFVNDLYKKYLKPDASDKHIIRVAFITTWVIGIITMLLAINPPSYLVVLYTAAVAFLASALFGPVVLGIWWKRMNGPGAAVGILVGAVSFWIAFALPLPASSQILIAMPLSIAASVVVSLATRKPTDNELKFVKRIHE
jgi:SSS family transporter